MEDPCSSMPRCSRWNNPLSQGVDSFGRACLAAGMASALAATPVLARTWIANPFDPMAVPTIQACIDSAGPADTVLVAPGWWHENIDFLGKEICVRAMLGPHTTTLYPEDPASPIVTFDTQETPEAHLEGIYLTGATQAPVIRIIDASPTLRDNTFQENENVAVFCDGGSPHLFHNEFQYNQTPPSPIAGTITVVMSDWDGPSPPAPVIEGNVFRSNTAPFGGAAFLGAGSAVFKDNQVIDNEVEYDGGGVFVWPSAGRVVITGNVFVHNLAGDHGGGIAAWNAYSGAVEITENLIVRNRASGIGAGGANGVGGAIHVAGKSGRIERNTIALNQSDVTCGGGGIGLSGEVQAGTGWDIHQNIIALNVGGEVFCDGVFDVSGITGNLVFAAEGDDCLNSLVCGAQILAMNLFADPLFCDESVDNFTVRTDSPALAGGAVIGAFSEPGCTGTPVKRMTWGALKSRFK